MQRKADGTEGEQSGKVSDTYEIIGKLGEGSGGLYIRQSISG